ncbi:RING-type domain-containing protein [Plasmodiophora brassicae]
MTTELPADDASSKSCLICVFPLVDVAVVPCAHDRLVCATCAVKITRYCGDPRRCPFCKSEWSDVIFDAAAKARPFTSYSNASLIPIPSIKASATSRELAANYNKLLTCHCVICDKNGVKANFLTLEKLQAHLRRDHKLMFCMVCAQHRKTFVGEMQLYTEDEMKSHMKHGRKGQGREPGMDPHPVCQFCRIAFYGPDEIYYHMEHDHYHCHFCRSSTEKHRYERTYKELEQHFRKHHYLCDDDECLKARYVVFASEVGLQAHRLQVHSANLTQKERRAMGNVQVELNYRMPNADAGGRRTPDPAVAAAAPNPPPEPVIALHDLEQFPQATTSSSTSTSMAGFAWAGLRSSSGAPTDEAFPTLEEAVGPRRSAPSARGAARQPVAAPSWVRNGPERAPAVVKPEAASARNVALTARMKQALRGDDGRVREFKKMAKRYLASSGDQESTASFFDAFIDIFGMSPESKQIFNEMVALMPADHPGHKRALLAVAQGPQARQQPQHHQQQQQQQQQQRQHQSQQSRPSPASSAPVIVPPTEEAFPSLSSLSLNGDATPSAGPLHRWSDLVGPVSEVAPDTLLVPPVVRKRLQFFAAFANDCLGMLQDRLSSEEGIPVTPAMLRRTRNTARSLKMVDLDIGYPLNGIDLSIQTMTQLQNLFRTAQNDYDSVRQRVLRALTIAPSTDLYVLVDYIAVLYQHIAAGCERKSSLRPDPEFHRADDARPSRRQQKSSKKRTLVLFG